jgi:hypothetical protein
MAPGCDPPSRGKLLVGENMNFEVVTVSKSQLYYLVTVTWAIFWNFSECISFKK